MTAKHIVDDSQIQTLVANHITDTRWREVFLLVAGLMNNADNLLLQMEAEIQNYIRNSPKLRSILGWANQITDGSAGKLNNVTKRAIAISSARGIADAVATVRARIRGIAKSSYSTDKGIAIARAIATAKARDGDINIDIDINRAKASIRALDSANIFKEVSFDELFAKLENLKNKRLIGIKDGNAIYQAWSNALNITPEMIDLSDE